MLTNDDFKGLFEDKFFDLCIEKCEKLHEDKYKERKDDFDESQLESLDNYFKDF